jgi:hypothetical protein
LPFPNYNEIAAHDHDIDHKRSIVFILILNIPACPVAIRCPHPLRMQLSTMCAEDCDHDYEFENNLEQKEGNSKRRNKPNEQEEKNVAKEHCGHNE